MKGVAISAGTMKAWVNRFGLWFRVGVIVLGWLLVIGSSQSAEAQSVPDPSGPPVGSDLERAAYLGVSTTPVDETLARHLSLTANTGLVVQYVDPESPAASVLKAHDILLKLNDQILVNHHQLAVLVRSQKPGDEVTLTLLRESRRMEVKVRLGEKDLPRLRPPADFPPVPRFGQPRFEAWTNFPSIPGWMKRGFFFDFDDEPSDEGAKQPSGRTRIRVRPGGAQGSPSAAVGGEARMRSVVSLSENGRTATLTETDAGKRLVVTDASGQTLFDGPVDSEEQRKQVPEGSRVLLDQLDQLNEKLKQEDETAIQEHRVL